MSEKPKEETKTEDKVDLTQAFISTMQEYGQQLVEKTKKEILAELDKMVEEVKKEAVTAVRRGLGVDADPVIHLSEIEGIVRKIALENAEPEKRSETVSKDKPTEEPAKEGFKLKTAQEIWDENNKNRGVP